MEANLFYATETFSRGASNLFSNIYFSMHKMKLMSAQIEQELKKILLNYDCKLAAVNKGTISKRSNYHRSWLAGA